jgi:hypothetical protein
MLHHTTNLEEAGYETVEPLLSMQQCGELEAALPDIDSSGSRTLLSNTTIRKAVDWFRANHQ